MNHKKEDISLRSEIQNAEDFFIRKEYHLKTY